MRQLSAEEINRLKLLTENSVEATLIEPTRTGLEKSIMDATGPVRNYLKEKNIHDFDIQKQGPSYKIAINSYFIEPGTLLPSVTTLYRPISKKGDPRIWFKGLINYASPNDILAIIEFNQTLYILNLTQIDVKKHLENKISTPLKDLITQINTTSNVAAIELLRLLKSIARKGPVPAMLEADTAIGRTLEKHLNININSSKQPDYRGIEIKSFRDQRDNRKTLFAQVPDWQLSKFKSSAEILRNFGYARGQDFKLYCTVSSRVKNSQGLRLEINSKTNQLHENSDKPGIGDFVTWSLETLHKRLLEKHNETFWIAATSVQIGGREHFLFKKAEHTKKPITSQFDILLEQGIITLDHLIKKNAAGKVVEKGPLFKIGPNALSLLFPPSTIYYLDQ